MATKEKKGKTKKDSSEEEVERSIQQALKDSPKSNKELRSATGADERVLTRSLQRLRRRGKLQVVKGRWTLATIKVCPKCEGRGWVKE